jgi:hypothetical protein
VEGIAALQIFSAATMYGYTVSPQELHSNSSFSTSTTGDMGNLLGMFAAFCRY